MDNFLANRQGLPRFISVARGHPTSRDMCALASSSLLEVSLAVSYFLFVGVPQRVDAVGAPAVFFGFS